MKKLPEKSGIRTVIQDAERVYRTGGIRRMRTLKSSEQLTYV